MLGYLRWRKWANNFSKKCWIESITQGLVNVLDIGDFEHLKYLLVIFGDEKNQQLGVQVGQLPTPVTVRLCFPDFPDPRQTIRPNPPWLPVSGCWSESSFRQPNQVADTETYTFKTFQEQSFAETRRISDGSSYSFFCRRNLSCEGLLPPLSIQPSLACSLPLLARGCLPTLIKPRFPSRSIPTQISLHWNTDKLEHCISKKCNPRRYNWTHIWTNVISEEPPIFRFRGYPSFSVGKGSCNLNGSGLVF